MNPLSAKVRRASSESIRTAMVNGQSTIHDAIKMLLPDCPIQSKRCIAVDGKIVDSTVLVEWVKRGKRLVMEGCGNMPSPLIVVEILVGDQGTDNHLGRSGLPEATLPRYIRPPFKIQAEWLKFKGMPHCYQLGLHSCPRAGRCSPLQSPLTVVVLILDCAFAISIRPQLLHSE